MKGYHISLNKEKWILQLFDYLRKTLENWRKKIKIKLYMNLWKGSIQTIRDNKSPGQPYHSLAYE